MKNFDRTMIMANQAIEAATAAMQSSTSSSVRMDTVMVTPILAEIAINLAVIADALTEIDTEDEDE